MTYGEAESNLILDKLVAEWAVLSDQGDVTGQLGLISDGIYRAYQGDQLVSTATGHEELSQAFQDFAQGIDRSFALNGSHVVHLDLDAGTATGILYTQLKVVRTVNDQEQLTDYSVRYNDHYVFVNGKWTIHQRDAHMIIVDQRTLPVSD